MTGSTAVRFAVHHEGRLVSRGPGDAGGIIVYYAHSGNRSGRWHPLHDHLADVSGLAAKFAASLPWRDEAALAGLLHDLGKYGDRFQARLRGDHQGLNHWSQGAWLALMEHWAVGRPFNPRSVTSVCCISAATALMVEKW